MKLECKAKQMFISTFYTLVFFAICLSSVCGYIIMSNDVNNIPKPSPTNPVTTSPKESDGNKKTGDALLEKNRRLWVDKKISNYNFVASLVTGGFSYPADPVRIRVRDQKIVSVERLNNDDQRDVFYYDEWSTVEKMFDKIIDESARGRDVTVKYNKEFGYPEDVGILMRGTTAWWSFTVKSFEIVDPKD